MQQLLPSEIARHLNVSRTEVVDATRCGDLCKGYPVAEWVLRRGRQILYEVPDETAEKIREPDAKHLKQQSRVLMVFMRGG